MIYNSRGHECGSLTCDYVDGDPPELGQVKSVAQVTCPKCDAKYPAPRDARKAPGLCPKCRR